MSKAIVLRHTDLARREYSELRAFEVVLAYNLQPPLRREQGYWWLETLAASPQEARDLARAWVNDQDDKMWECTDWVRLAGPHPETWDASGSPLPLYWSSPIEEGCPEGLPVRDPSTGHRLGYFFSVPGLYGALHRRPVRSSEQTGWVPLVQIALPRESKHHQQMRPHELPEGSEGEFLLNH